MGFWKNLLGDTKSAREADEFDEERDKRLKKERGEE